MPRRPLTDRQREIGSTRRAHKAMVEQNVAAHEATQGITTRNRLEQEHIHQQQRIDTESQLASDRSSRARSQAIQGAVVSTATPSSDSGLIMTTMFVMFGLVVIYALVHNPGPTTGFLGNLGTGLHALSSNTPLFKTTTKATS